MTGAARLFRFAAAMFFVAATARPGIGYASQPTMNECFEASDFIRNAALSRDGGVRSEVFLGRMEDDFSAMGSFPPQLRWFAHDPDDEAFLLAEARAVFERPAAAETHRVEFLRACIERMTAASAPSAPESP
jgi:hypothetical protein